MIWYSQLFKNFPEVFVIHRVKGFGIADKAEADVFLELSCFFNDAKDVKSLVLLPFLIQLEHPQVHGSCTVEAWLGEF